MKDSKNRIYKTIMLVILTAFITFMITSLYIYRHFENLNEKEYIGNNFFSNNQSESSDLENYLKRIKTVIDKYYLWKDDIDEEKLNEYAIKGYVAGLGDEYTEYISPEEMEEYKEEIVGNFTGIGIYMTVDEKAGRVVVYYPIPGTPAEKAGIKAGDLIISVDGKEYTSEEIDSISDYIKGKEDTTVNLVVERNGERLSYSIVREKINVNPVTSKIIDNKIGYIKIPSFDQDTSKNFKTKVEELLNDGATSLVIDLRNNGGGIVEEAVQIADYLLDKDKKIITTINNQNKEKITYSKEDPIFTMNVVILANSRSASASEILIGALKDNERAKFVGECTYGKGVIQSVLTLTDGSGLKVTSEEYMTPNGEKINKAGIKPDEEVKLPDNISNIYAVKEEEDTQLKRATELLK